MSDPHAPHADASGLEQELLEDQALSAAERYAAFLAAVADSGRFWVAESGEYLLTLFDGDGQELLPAWPSAATARAALAQARAQSPNLAGYAPAARELSAWRERAAAAMDEAGVGVGAFPDLAMQCAVVAPAQLLEHLDALIAESDADAATDADETDGDAGDDSAGAPAALDLAQAQRALAQKFAKPKGD
ncbi:DUF2750 domain-containing protein [Lysobacter enzymogenes]|uniref:DUF2750 domain-containing protein n=1 Tax=Lysobacter enzymogenes TaxID=69 RepID=UPI001AFA61D8|nr:DUF2750 domain-containing protein [Lysobacter enzymogenes]QQQ01569.1 DUF2750 domain-containing protein [Lysobacter enzymogenes]